MYFQDPGWQKVCNFAESDSLACSLHGRVETIAALHRKLREGSLPKPNYLATLAEFESDCVSGAIHWFPVSVPVVERVRQAYSTLPSLQYLRAADALHLACAAENGFRKIY